MGSFFSKPSARANVYADHPFTLLETPVSKLPSGSESKSLERVASIMVLVHNIIFRGLNSIYLQAPHVTPADALAFAHYMHQWHRMLHEHHHGEETICFPAIERLTGEEGIMEVNVAQHREFGDGLAAFEKYTLECIADPTRFDGHRVIKIVDSFGDVLNQHLNEEISTLLALERFGEEKMAPLESIFGEEGKEVMKNSGLTTGLPLAALNHDRHFENDLWLHAFPEDRAGHVAMFVTRRIASWVHPSWWKFASCDRSGTMQKLYAAKEGTVKVDGTE